MISLDLAHRLHDAGVAWTPGNGDRFWLPDRELDQTVFTVSDMVVEVRDLPAGRILAFNGTTEWRWTPSRSTRRSGCRASTSCSTSSARDS